MVAEMVALLDMDAAGSFAVAVGFALLPCKLLVAGASRLLEAVS